MNDNSKKGSSAISVRPKRPSDEWLKAIITSAMDCIVAIDVNGAIIEFNQAAEKTFGYKKKQVEGKFMADLIIPERFRDAHQKGIAHFLTTHEPRLIGRRVEVTALRASGEEFPVELTIIPVNERRDPVFTAYIRDISERKEYEKQRIEHEHELTRLLNQTIQSVTRTLESKDPYTAGHQLRVAELSVRIAKHLGLSDEVIQGINYGSMIHDIGKIAVPSEILNRPGTLTPVAMSMVKTHCEIGYQIAKDIEFPWPVAEMIFQHHERQDGSGYPRGLVGDEILIEAQVIAVADVVEAITAHRPYRKAHPLSVAFDEIKTQAGIRYNPEVVAICVQLFEDNFAFENHDIGFN